MAKPEKIRRFIPCSLYCTSEIESWLEGMASEGYIFYAFSKFDYAVFIKEEPQKIHYRLCLKGSIKRESEIQNLMFKYGWESAGDIKNLFIFSSKNPTPFEADDENKLSELRDEALKHFSRQSIVNFISPLLIITMFFFTKEIAIDSVRFGVAGLLLPISMIMSLIIWGTIEITDIRTYKKHISNNNSYVFKFSKVNLCFYAAKYISAAAIFVSLAVLLISSQSGLSNDIWYNSLSENENPPFATVEDFVTVNASKTGNSETDPGALYNKWSNKVSKLNYYWHENADYLHTDGTTENIKLIVDYHDTFSPLLAKWLIWDYYWNDKSIKITSDVNRISGYDIDYGLAYHNWGYLVVIAQKDNKIIKAEFSSVRTTHNEPIITTEGITDEEAIAIICSNF